MKTYDDVLAELPPERREAILSRVELAIDAMRKTAMCGLCDRSVAECSCPEVDWGAVFGR